MREKAPGHPFVHDKRESLSREEEVMTEDISISIVKGTVNALFRWNEYHGAKRAFLSTLSFYLN